MKSVDVLPFYVYTWAYPDGVVFYVGMGTGERVTATGPCHRNYLAYRIREEVEAMGEQVQMVIIARFKVRQHAHVFEKMLIATYGIKNLANKKTEEGVCTRDLARPHMMSTVQFSTRSATRLIDQITLQNVTRQPWEDDGAAI